MPRRAHGFTHTPWPGQRGVKLICHKLPSSFHSFPLQVDCIGAGARSDNEWMDCIFRGGLIILQLLVIDGLSIPLIWRLNMTGVLLTETKWLLGLPLGKIYWTDPPPKKLLCFKSHILGSSGVKVIWLRGAKNTPKTDLGGSKRLYTVFNGHRPTRGSWSKKIVIPSKCLSVCMRKQHRWWGGVACCSFIDTFCCSASLVFRSPSTCVNIHGTWIVMSQS